MIIQPPLFILPLRVTQKVFYIHTFTCKLLYFHTPKIIPQFLIYLSFFHQELHKISFIHTKVQHNPRHQSKTFNFKYINKSRRAHMICYFFIFADINTNAAVSYIHSFRTLCINSTCNYCFSCKQLPPIHPTKVAYSDSANHPFHHLTLF